MDEQLQISFAETKYVLKHLTKEEKEKIPAKLRRFITDNSVKNHNIDLNKLNKRTYALLAVLYRKYLAENKNELEEEHKERLKKENIARAKMMNSLNNSNKT